MDFLNKLAPFALHRTLASNALGQNVATMFSSHSIANPLLPITNYIGLQCVNWSNKLAVLGLDLDAT